MLALDASLGLVVGSVAMKLTMLDFVAVVRCQKKMPPSIFFACKFS